LFLHRPYFASAMSHFAVDPLGSPFGYSVRASFRSACIIIAKIAGLFEKEPELSVRIWLYWTQLFTSCLVLGAIVVRSPNCIFASTALAELDGAYELMDRAKAGVRPAAILPQVRKLREKAHTAFRQYYSDQSGVAAPANIDVSAELAALGGNSYLVSLNPSSTSPPETCATQRSTSPTTSPSTPLISSTQMQPLPTGTRQEFSYGEGDWTLSSSFSLDSFPQQPYDIPISIAENPTYPSDTLSNEAHMLFGQPADPTLAGNELPLDSQPTWQSFMTQMGFI